MKAQDRSLINMKQVCPRAVGTDETKFTNFWKTGSYQVRWVGKVLTSLSKRERYTICQYFIIIFFQKVPIGHRNKFEVDEYASRFTRESGENL